MPRRPVVTRTMSVIDVSYKYYDKVKMTLLNDVQRFDDYRMAEQTIINAIEKIYPDRKVLTIDNVATSKVKFSLDLKDFMKVASCEKKG